MKNTWKISAAASAVATAVVLVGSASAGELNPRSSTQNLVYGDVLKIRLPLGLCEFEQVVPAYVVDTLKERRDWPRLVEYMLVNCPELGLPLADTATASISEPGVDESGDGSGGGTAGGGTGAGGTDGGGTGGGGTGGGGAGEEDTSDDDGNNGHGNDADHHDESNPGKS
jgi:uncharacterized membrane protein YgcG